MGILANALPGFRDLRAPLIAGYLWLLFGWLLVQPSLPPPESTDTPFLETLLDLGGVIGQIAIAIAVSVAAYLVGSISRTGSVIVADATRWCGRPLKHLALLLSRWMEPAPGAWSSRKGPRDRPMPLDPFDAQSIDPLAFGPPAPRQKLRSRLGAWLHRVGAVGIAPATERLQSLVDERVEPGDRQLGRLLEQVDELAMERHELLGKEVKALTAQAEEARANTRRADVRLSEELGRELSLPATLLLGDRPEMFAEADRIRAEAEVRLAVVPPLSALAVLLGATASELWLLSFAGIVALAIQGLRKEDDARGVIAGAIVFKKADSVTLKRWDDGVAHELENEREGLRQGIDTFRDLCLLERSIEQEQREADERRARLEQLAIALTNVHDRHAQAKRQRPARRHARALARRSVQPQSQTDRGSDAVPRHVAQADARRELERAHGVDPMAGNEAHGERPAGAAEDSAR